MTPEIVAGWLTRIIGHEGGLSMDTNDPGNWTGGRPGAGVLKGTKWGIAANTYPDLDIKDLTVEQAADIYIRDYLEPLNAERLRDGVVFQLLDFAVNSGIQTAVRKLQQAVGVADDGIIGPVTVSVLEGVTESDLIMRILAERLDYLTRLTGWERYGRGWARRIAKNLRHGADDSD